MKPIKVDAADSRRRNSDHHRRCEDRKMSHTCNQIIIDDSKTVKCLTPAVSFATGKNRCHWSVNRSTACETLIVRWNRTMNLAHSKRSLDNMVSNANQSDTCTTHCLQSGRVLFFSENKYPQKLQLGIASPLFPLLPLTGPLTFNIGFEDGLHDVMPFFAGHPMASESRLMLRSMP